LRGFHRPLADAEPRRDLGERVALETPKAGLALPRRERLQRSLEIEPPLQSRRLVAAPNRDRAERAFVQRDRAVTPLRTAPEPCLVERDAPQPGLEARSSLERADRLERLHEGGLRGFFGGVGVVQAVEEHPRERGPITIHERAEGVRMARLRAFDQLFVGFPSLQHGGHGRHLVGSRVGSPQPAYDRFMANSSRWK